MTGILAAGLTVSGAYGVLILFALLLFAAAAAGGFFAPAHRMVQVLIAAGLALYMLALLWV